MKSALYQGSVRHTRLEPVRHEFSYRMFQVYLDLAELDEVFAGRWFWSTRRFAIARFRREDHLGDPSVALDEAVRDFVEERAGVRPPGPVRLLTHLRYFGYVMNPVSFYYCFREDESRVEFVVAEINNTPWRERFCYLVDLRDDGGEWVEHRFRKAFHVSPFMPMDVEYRWRFSAPADRLDVFMENRVGDRGIFHAYLGLERYPVSGVRLAWLLVSFPLMTLRVILGIYWQAFRLWLKGAPYSPHPKHERPSEVSG